MFSDQILCPSTSSGDNVQCCIENLDRSVHDGLKAREAQDYSESAEDLGPNLVASSNVQVVDNPEGDIDPLVDDETEQNTPPTYLNLENGGLHGYSDSYKVSQQSTPQTLNSDNPGVQSGPDPFSPPPSNPNGLSFDINNHMAPAVKYAQNKVFASLKTGATIPSIFSSGLDAVSHSVQGNIGVNFRMRR